MKEIETREASAEQKPSFDGGTYLITHLSTSPQGFEVTTRNSMLRHEPGTPLPFAREIYNSKKLEPLRFRVNTLHPRRKSNETPQDVRDEVLERYPKLNPEFVKIEDDHVRLTPGFSAKVGIRNAKAHANVLSIDTVPVTYSTFRELGFPEKPIEAQEMARTGAISIILTTTESDGSHKLIVQNRSESNEFYGGVTGASVAGIFDGKLDRNNRGRLEPVTTESIRTKIAGELDEELGIPEEHLDVVSINALAFNKPKVVDEFLLSAQINLSGEQIADLVEKRGKEKRLNDDFDFEGKYFLIDATPEAIFTLLTEVRSPLPPTHSAGFAVVGYRMMIESSGIDKANEWLRKLESGVRANYDETDRIVREYWKANPELAKIQPDNRPERRLSGYDEAYLPSEQGLPDVNSELKRTGLISES